MTKSAASLVLPGPPTTMICFFFVRRGDMLRVEVRADKATREFALVVKEGSGLQRRDDFADSESLQQGLTRMSAYLQEERWRPAGLPIEIHQPTSALHRKRLWQRAAVAFRKIF